jgi:hypothetical protein
MPGPHVLVVELCRDGAEIKKHTVVDRGCTEKTGLLRVSERFWLRRRCWLMPCRCVRAIG